ncbi:MAG: Endonuclease [Microgenomates group bacterium GW2011_GWC1_41_8]|uniref:Endonuclease n=3 Tax=Candidatus Roizmaniibacteriota TaxID=1752723 RepID=A0A0G1ABJ4_9BACT|nr:MAG: Endonuclease [Candidatus Roizmanbacteria bacterium GW2011_GWB1_40_7]KKR91161.1 MAG: Endonuclease [Candidatus Roizmanbacteria bacterium GW2011_GWA1_41_13]KKS22608.1 MAG: Endonuclease [Candidatus Roizmanbacteria bacterium GW2011_GWC2_41_7]KKS23133.1 MAG: Endonuclease [Microgenomates group bacterium GW2011_GWC1_41_8]OGK49338.1 MAG: hypothetical protein A3A55_01105 [Candidatus Roizmanbacteria bacterium RIFCSPLOWO2_01_FULL_40_14]
MVYYVYILASKKNGTLYVGITNNLLRRIWEHKQEYVQGFTKRYRIHMLVYYEEYSVIHDALNREKQLKWWNRKWKIELIESKNAQWKDLYNEIL